MKTKVSAVDQLKDQLAKKNHTIRLLRSQIAELKEFFEVRSKADGRAIKRWHEAHAEKTNLWPDQADLCVWLMEQIDVLREENAKLKSERDEKCITTS